MNTKRKWKSKQAFVDSIVYQCLEFGIRNRDKIISIIQIERITERNRTDPNMLTGLEDLDIHPKNLIIAVSRTTSRKDSHGHRDIWCVPGVHRYVSLSRLSELVAESDQGALTPEQVVELGQSRDDLHKVALHLEEKARTMFADAYKVRDRAVNAHSAVLDFGEDTTLAPAQSGR